MQPVRVIIAAIFFVIGALIVIPAFTSGPKNNTSNAEPVPSSSSPTVTPSTTTTTAKPSPTKSATPTATKSSSPKPTSRNPVPPAPTSTPSATPSQTSTAPTLVPLKITFGKVDCPRRLVTIKVVNDDPATTQGYSIVRDGSIVLADQLGPRASRSSELTLKEDKSTTVRITQDGKSRARHVYKANCTKASPSKSAKPDSTPNRTLPKTGSDETVMFARIATGGASLLTGAIVLWWGGLWPRRKDKMLG